MVALVVTVADFFDVVLVFLIRVVRVLCFFVACFVPFDFKDPAAVVFFGARLPSNVLLSFERSVPVTFVSASLVTVLFSA